MVDELINAFLKTGSEISVHGLGEHLNTHFDQITQAFEQYLDQHPTRSIIGEGSEPVFDILTHFKGDLRQEEIIVSILERCWDKHEMLRTRIAGGVEAILYTVRDMAAFPLALKLANRIVNEGGSTERLCLIYYTLGQGRLEPESGPLLLSILDHEDDAGNIGLIIETIADNTRSGGDRPNETVFKKLASMGTDAQRSIVFSAGWVPEFASWLTERPNSDVPPGSPLQMFVELVRLGIEPGHASDKVLVSLQ